MSSKNRLDVLDFLRQLNMVVWECADPERGLKSSTSLLDLLGTAREVQVC